MTKTIRSAMEINVLLHFCFSGLWSGMAFCIMPIPFLEQSNERNCLLGK